MSVSPPTKPPRGVKQGKETSGLLMSVIRTLSASETNEQREKERAKLEKEYKKSDARLDELVAQHADDIQDVMQKFNQVSAGLAAWGQHCDSATARLTACRSLLQLRRDDLKRLWALSRTHHYALNMLTDISRVVSSESECRVTGDATRVLAQAASMRHALDVAGRLSHVSALSTTRENLQMKKNELVDTIVRQISTAVYHDDGNTFTRQMSHRRTALLLAELTKPEEVTESFLQDITPEFEASLTEEDRTFETNVMICLEALAVLEQLKEATEKFKVQIQDELLNIIDTVSRRIMETNDIEDPVCEQDNDILEKEVAIETGKLARLVAVLADEFRACGARNKRLIQLWRATLQKHKISDSCLHTEQHYWSAVQQVLQLLLTEYLDICRVNLAAQREHAPRPQTKLTEYFAKKRPNKRTGKLFHFTTTAEPTITVRRQRYPLVCTPHPAHLYSVLPTVDSLCNTINNGGECSLRAFITDYIRCGETERLCAWARGAMAALHTDARERATVDHRVVYGWVAATWRIVHSTVALLRRCAQCTLLDANVATSAVRAAMLHCNTNMDTGTPPTSRASKWLSDDDIVRFLKSLPNWRAVQHPTNEDNSEELTQSYEREAEILGASLADGTFSPNEIVTDVNVLTDIALYMESMAWLSEKVRTIPGSLASCGLKLGERFLNDVAAAAEVFDDKCNKNLLFLHLEFRIQCFQLIGAEDGAAQLTRTLLAFNENTSSFVSPQRRAYILQGIAEMMSRGMIHVAGVGGAGGAGGAGAEGALAAARHCLAALHLSHSALYTADTYRALLPHNPQEIIRMIIEEGPRFTELEYMNVFKIIGQRQGLSQAELQGYFKQLSSALGNIGVTV